MPEMAAVIGQKWINTNSLFPGKMVKDHLIANWFQLALFTVPAFDPGFVTDGRFPFIPTGWGIAGCALGRLPALGIDILTPPEKVAEQLDFLFCGEVGMSRNGIQ